MTYTTLPDVKPALHPQDRGGPQQPLLIVEDLKKHFPLRKGVLNRQVGAVQAVDGVSFSVDKGEVLGIVGESGCGKSTLARLLMRMMEPDAGSMIFDGDPVGEHGGISTHELHRAAQMVFQDSFSSLNPRMTIVDTIAFAPMVNGVSSKQALDRARMLLNQVGLPTNLFAKRYPHELSGGQRQRVNIARALAVEPRLIILDEPVSALDKSVEAQVLNLLLDLQHLHKLTYIFISHDLNVVRYISDRVAVMYLGRIVETGHVDDIYDNPRHPYTRALLASKPSLDPRRRIRDAPLSGDPPNPINPPSGCRFRTRCPNAEAICEQHSPASASVPGDDEHYVSCHMSAPTYGHSKAFPLHKEALA
ncbi:ABC transporter ATP-binding protein [Bordetella sp. N]|uniref:ABC transporter ATP-binding protein n=1 Tax=Bordetella sp. N TaxID=1746199 RepID=UPI00070F13D0|nr:ABC transporter ATP-binding protein [Bordetella sp. N]ALM86465.1 dipeptide/oligopeptide/nickel ABC transporter ATP-binding protein [Bordetella sp. N]